MKAFDGGPQGWGVFSGDKDCSELSFRTFFLAGEWEWGRGGGPHCGPTVMLPGKAVLVERQGGDGGGGC